MSFPEFDRTAAKENAEQEQSDRMALLKSRLPENKYKALCRVPPRYIGRLTKALTGTKNKKVLIKAMCEQCVGWENAQEVIKHCSSYLCALHPHRPHQ